MPDPLDASSVVASKSPQRRSILIALIGLIWSLFSALLFLVLCGISGPNGADMKTTVFAWGGFGPHVIMGLYFTFGGRFMLRRHQALFILASVSSFLVALAVWLTFPLPHERVEIMGPMFVFGIMPLIVSWISPLETSPR